MLLDISTRTLTATEPPTANVRVEFVQYSMESHLAIHACAKLIPTALSPAIIAIAMMGYAFFVRLVLIRSPILEFVVYISAIVRGYGSMCLGI